MSLKYRSGWNFIETINRNFKLSGNTEDVGDGGYVVL